MQSLIKDVLDYSRIGLDKKMGATNCNSIVKDVLDDLATAIKESNPKIYVEALPVINCYSEIRLLFQNLISNAIKFICITEEI